MQFLSKHNGLCFTLIQLQHERFYRRKIVYSTGEKPTFSQHRVEKGVNLCSVLQFLPNKVRDNDVTINLWQKSGFANNGKIRNHGRICNDNHSMPSFLSVATS